MRSKRDQVQAHTFMMGRLTSGMLLADPDAPESPLGRTTRGALIGIIVGILIAAGAFVYGLLRPGGNDSWRGGDSLIVNKDTGARYLYSDGRLRPVRNYASALLIGGAGLKTTTVGTNSLKGTPVGAPVGIAGAPDGVPDPGDLERSAWEVCSTGGGEETTLVPGAPVENLPIGAGSALVVQGPDNRTYLMWQGSRLELDEKSGAAESLGYGAVAPRPVSAAFLDTLVSGPKLATPKVTGRGAKGPVLAGRKTRVGQVVRVTAGSGSQDYVVQKDGLHAVTATQSALLLGDPDTRRKAYADASPAAVAIGVSDLRAHQAPGTAGSDPSVTGLPDSPPSALRLPTGQAACTRIDPDGGAVRVTSVRIAETVLSPYAAADSTALIPACVTVDHVVTRPGRGTLVRVLGAAGATVGNTTFLVGDDGVKYRVADAEALAALGYSDGDAVKVPSTLLSLLPTGPDLNTKAAARSASDTGAGKAASPATQCAATGAEGGGARATSRSAGSAVAGVTTASGAGSGVRAGASSTGEPDSGAFASHRPAG
ncbi:type VII secretion protein EccB [Streptomyces sp. ITFR-16]|uniref:type VII secretion protein EccB n=1 Tax=Streptomyces sp. ITFR-16 TaxID=3075198 RepID=UPI00288A093A|nr:type VII secretion protein EccB [Streptomyces sp. ITFR-16]WNI21445.1 type VII secretion protein EccB [Streptomyces sp. ITFR-16]